MYIITFVKCGLTIYVIYHAIFWKDWIIILCSGVKLSTTHAAYILLLNLPVCRISARALLLFSQRYIHYPTTRLFVLCQICLSSYKSLPHHYHLTLDIFWFSLLSFIFISQTSINLCCLRITRRRIMERRKFFRNLFI